MSSTDPAKTGLAKGAFGIREVAQILDVTEHWVRGHLRAGFLEPDRGADGRPVFRFQDLVLLRTAQRLLDGGVSPRRVRRALARLRHRLPEGQPLSGVQLTLEGDELVVTDPTGRWSPESGQAVFEFDASDEAPISALESAPRSELLELDDDFLPDFEVTVVPMGPPPESIDDDAAAHMSCADWMDLAEAYEAERRPLKARDALRRALEAEPLETEARVRLARLLEAEGRLESAERHLDLARRLRPHEPEIALEHGRLLAQLSELDRSLQAFEAAIELDADCIDAYLGAADIHERLGHPAAAVQILKEVRRRRRDPPEE